VLPPIRDQRNFRGFPCSCGTDDEVDIFVIAESMIMSEHFGLIVAIYFSKK